MTDPTPARVRLQCICGQGFEHSCVVSWDRPNGEYRLTPEPADQPMTKFGPLVQGTCPACHRAALFLGSGGYVTCGNLTCPDPSAATDVLQQQPTPAEHCTHSVHTHRAHHHQPVTGCPWCTEDATKPHTVDTGKYL